MAVKLDLSDLDEVLGYHPPSHSMVGLPTSRPPGTPAEPVAPDIPHATSFGKLPGQPVTPDIPSLSDPSMANSPGRVTQQFKPPDITAAAGTPEYGQQRQARLDAEKMHPWGSDDGTVTNHPGTWGKIGHVAAKIGNIAGDAVIPGVMANIPGTDMNKQRQERENQGWIKMGADTEEKEAGTEEKKAQAKNLQEQGEEVPWQTPSGETVNVRKGDYPKLEVNKEKGGTAEDIVTQKGKQATELQTQKGDQAQTLQTNKGQVAEDLAGKKIAATAAEGSANRVSREHIAANRENMSHLIAQDHDAVARERTAAANDPNKLTNTMKTMKEQAAATLPQIDKAIQETAAVKDLLGPGAGRWNQFMQGKIGVSDPRYAHYADEIHMVSTAVTLAHARGRMSNELYESFQKMFDTGKQSPENMVQALDVAKEWLGGYASMGEGGVPQPTATAGSGGGGGGRPSVKDWLASRSNAPR